MEASDYLTSDDALPAVPPQPTSVEEARQQLAKWPQSMNREEFLVDVDALIASVRAEERACIDDIVRQQHAATLQEVREIARNIATKRLCTVGRTSLDRSASAFLADFEVALDAIGGSGLAKMEGK